MRWMWLVAMGVGAFVGAGCIETGVNEDKIAAGASSLDPDILVEPGELAFEQLVPGSSSTQILRITNTGADDLQVSDMRIVGTSAFTLVDFGGPFTLPFKESKEITVQFAPINPEDQGELTIYSNDPGDPATLVPLSGGAVVPELLVSPNPYNFGLVPVGCSADGEITLQNIGDAPLTVRGLVDTLSNLTTSPVIDAAHPLVLQPGAYQTVTMTLDVPELRPYTTDLTIDSDNIYGPVSVRVGGEGTEETDVVDEFVQGDGPWEVTDIMVYVDRSCSMEDDTQNLAQNFNLFADALASVNLDWQLMVVTMDDGCHNGPFITDETPDPAGPFLDAVVGADGRYTEAGLTIADNAMREALGGCNDGFLRDNAKTMLVLVSDEPEQSAQPWDAMVDSIHASAPNASITSIVGDMPYGCPTAAAGTGYYEASIATGGAFLSVCAPDWGDYFETIATITATGKTDTFRLSSRPDPATLHVFINDAETTTGWAYESISNAVVFEEAYVPESNSHIRITYGLLADCNQ